MIRGATAICGLHAVSSAIDSAPDKALTLWLSRTRRDKRIQSIMDKAAQHGIAIQYADRDKLDEYAEGRAHQGVVLLTRPASPHNERDLSRLVAAIDGVPLILVLDGVTDPHNLGACLRTAGAVGVHIVIAPKDRAVGLNATVRKVASGAAEHLPFIPVTNLARTLKQLQGDGMWITGMAMQGKDIYQSDLTGPQVIVMGGEGSGMRRLTREHCDQLVYIPVPGAVGSLNVSVAAGVVLYETMRQRLALERSHEI